MLKNERHTRIVSVKEKYNLLTVNKVEKQNNLQYTVNYLTK